jgi:hypothetical protein
MRFDNRAGFDVVTPNGVMKSGPKATVDIEVTMELVEGVPVRDVRSATIHGLPERRRGVLVIVNASVGRHAWCLDEERDDLVVPGKLRDGVTLTFDRVIC